MAGAFCFAWAAPQAMGTHSVQTAGLLRGTPGLAAPGQAWWFRWGSLPGLCQGSKDSWAALRGDMVHRPVRRLNGHGVRCSRSWIQQRASAPDSVPGAYPLNGYGGQAEIVAVSVRQPAGEHGGYQAGPSATWLPWPIRRVGSPMPWSLGGAKGSSGPPRRTSPAGHRARRLGTGGACSRAGSQKKFRPRLFSVEKTKWARATEPSGKIPYIGTYAQTGGACTVTR